MIASTQFTLRCAYETYLMPDHLKPRTIESYYSLIAHWEKAKLTTPGCDPTERIPAGNPDMRKIDNVSLLEFRRYLAAKLAPNSVRKYLKHLFVILNRIGPKSLRNPEGLGLISDVPYVRPPAEVRRKPRTATAEEISAIYQVADLATWPECEVPPPLWWRSLLVALYNVGLRRLDYLSARQDEFDLRLGVVSFDAEKTGKESTLPLHPVVISHLLEIWQPERALVWPWRHGQTEPDPIDKKKTSLYGQWHRLRKAAGVERKITPHDIRRTCGSDLFSISPAAASECLQHSSIVTTQRSYVDCSRETRELMLGRQQPPIFTGNPPDDHDGGPAIIPFRAG